MNAHLGNAPDGIVISLSKKHAVFKKVGKDEPLPEGAKVSEDDKNLRTLTKGEKDAIFVPDGSTIRLISPYNDVTKNGMELVGPKSLKATVEAIQKSWPPKAFKEDEKITKMVYDKSESGVHVYKISID